MIIYLPEDIYDINVLLQKYDLLFTPRLYYILQGNIYYLYSLMLVEKVLFIHQRC